MLIPEDILQTLICSECQRYLSVPPIKVYHNRQIKCGRCSTKDDNGIVSPFYEMIVKDFEFPCINHYEGCEQILKHGKKVRNHEKQCVSDKYECPYLCSDFCESAYYLHIHLKNMHLLNRLTALETLVQLDKGEVDRISWFCQDNILLILLCRYDTLEQKLFLHIATFGKKNKKYVNQEFTLLTLDNNIIQTCKDIPCSMWGSALSEDVEFDIDTKIFPNQVVVCKFKLNYLSSHIPIKLPFTQESRQKNKSRNECISASFTFKNVRNLDKTPFYIPSCQWKIFILKNRFENQEFLSVGLKCEDSDDLNVNDGDVLVRFILKGFKNNICRQGSQNIFKDYEFSRFIEWDRLMNKSEGFLKNDDSINFIVQIDLRSSKYVLGKKNPTVINPSADCVKICCIFKNVSLIYPKILNYFDVEFIIHNVRWKILIQKFMFDNEYFLGIFLECQTPDIFLITNPDQKISTTFKLKGSKNDLCFKALPRSKLTNLKDNIEYGVPKFILWDQLIDDSQGFIKDDNSLNINVYVNMKKETNNYTL